MSNPLLNIQHYGQSIWYDNIDRTQLESGEFQNMLDNDGIVGVTANPTIFEKSISSSTAYNNQMRELIHMGVSVNDIYEMLVMTDVRTVADMLHPIYQQTNGKDGYVSLEVSPNLAHNTQGTIEEARRFWKEVNRPNLMIKIPATSEGIPAIRTVLADGINVNITLIFSLHNYQEVANAYLEALEERTAQGKSVEMIASVASFFVSRVDTLVDSLLEARIQQEANNHTMNTLQLLAGKAAIANSKLVYQAFRTIFESERFRKLEARGAHVQRPLWASTSTKNPAYRDVIYAEELIGHNTVDTMPTSTINNFRDHGKARNSIEENLEECRQTLTALNEVGIDYDAITSQLQTEGIQKFVDSFTALFAQIQEKQHALVQR